MQQVENFNIITLEKKS